MNTAFTLSRAAAAVPRSPPPLLSKAVRMLSSCWETVVFAASMTAPSMPEIGANFSENLSRIADSLPPVRLSRKLKPVLNMFFTLSIATAAAPRMPPPLLSKVVRMLFSFSETTAFADSSAEPNQLPIAPKIPFITSIAVLIFSLTVPISAVTPSRNHSHLFHKRTNAEITATMPITTHVTGFARSAPASEPRLETMPPTALANGPAMLRMADIATLPPERIALNAVRTAPPAPTAKVRIVDSVFGIPLIAEIKFFPSAAARVNASPIPPITVSAAPPIVRKPPMPSTIIMITRTSS